MKAIIVDDEPPARREMRRLLAAHAEIKVVGEAADVATARGLLLRTRPNVVFLDIRLGRQSGFDLLPDVDSHSSVVFVTAFDEYAVKAFEESAVDYLMKPVDAVRLDATVQRLLDESGDTAPAIANRPRVYASDRWTFVDSSDGQEFIELATITHIEADGGGSRLFTADGRSRSTGQSLLSWERRLTTGDFVRVHRSAIVNLRYVEGVEPWFQYTYRIRIRGAREPVVMSRRHAARLRDMLA